MFRFALTITGLAVFCLVSPTTALQPAPPTMQYVIAFFRHGIRTPVYNKIKTDPNKDKYAALSGGVLGGLSTNGVRLMYKVGQVLSTRYEGFLGGYTEASVRFSSTDSSRTIKSALSVATGIFPPHPPIIRDFPWQPILVSQTTRNFDLSWVFGGAVPGLAVEYCPKYGELMKKGLQVLVMPDRRPEYTRLYELLQQYTEDPTFRSTSHIIVLLNTLHFSKLNDLELPQWATTPQEEYNNRPIYPDLLLIFFPEYFEAMQYQNRDKEMLSFFTGPLFHGINEKLREKATKKGLQEKFWYHSTHDTTIYALLRALKIEDILTAEPGDGLIFELHEEGSQTFVKILYFKADIEKNHLLREMDTPLCPSPCLLDTFISSFKGCTHEEFEAKCKL